MRYLVGILVWLCITTSTATSKDFDLEKFPINDLYRLYYALKGTPPPVNVPNSGNPFKDKRERIKRQEQALLQSELQFGVGVGEEITFSYSKRPAALGSYGDVSNSWSICMETRFSATNGSWSWVDLISGAMSGRCYPLYERVIGKKADAKGIFFAFGSEANAERFFNRVEGKRIDVDIKSNECTPEAGGSASEARFICKISEITIYANGEKIGYGRREIFVKPKVNPFLEFEWVGN